MALKIGSTRMFGNTNKTLFASKIWRYGHIPTFFSPSSSNFGGSAIYSNYNWLGYFSINEPSCYNKLTVLYCGY